jgi:hypothetical protein
MVAKWGDLLEEEEQLPPSTVNGPDAKGITTKVDYFRNDKGEVMKKITKTKTIKIQKKIYEVRTYPPTNHFTVRFLHLSQTHHRPAHPFSFNRSPKIEEPTGSSLEMQPQNAPRMPSLPKPQKTSPSNASVQPSRPRKKKQNRPTSTAPWLAPTNQSLSDH